MTEPEENYIGRKAAAEMYRRGERTLERDISQAMKLQDDEFLSSIRLRTKDGGVLPGRVVTFEKIDALKNSGQVPTWEIAESFLAERYGLRSDGPRKGNQTKTPDEGTAEPGPANSQTPPVTSGHPTPSRLADEVGLPPLPRDSVEQAALLKALYQDLQRSLQAERERNNKIFALIETIPKQQEQTNILLREFQELMKSSSALLPMPRATASKDEPRQIVEAKDAKSAPVIDAKVSDLPKPQRVRSHPKKKAPKHPAKPAKRKVPKAAAKRPTFTESYLSGLSRLLGLPHSKRK